MVAVVPRTGVEMNMIFSKVRVERNVQRFQEKRKNGMNAKFSAKCVALVAAGAMSMSLAACSGGSMDDSSSSNGSAANSDTITLGSVTTNSGTAAAYGEAEVAGFKLAVDEINAKGGINGKKVKLESMDDKGDATEASNAFNKLAGDNSVLLHHRGRGSAGRPVQAGHHRPGRHLRLHRDRWLYAPHLLQGLLPG